jgi:hypothetical protein
MDVTAHLQCKRSRQAKWSCLLHRLCIEVFTCHISNGGGCTRGKLSSGGGSSSSSSSGERGGCGSVGVRCRKEKKNWNALAVPMYTYIHILGLKLRVFAGLSYSSMRPWATSVWGLKLLVKCMRPSATSQWGRKLPVYAALSYWCMRPSATSVWGLKLLVYEALSYQATSVWGLKLLVYEALSC